MKNHYKPVLFLFLVVFSFLSANSFAQKGTIKIFSEVKGTSVFLDEVFKGNDIMTLDSVEVGAHYLKVLKNEVIIFGELVTITKNAITTILIKNDEKLGNKLLATKSDDINKYINNKLEVILSNGSETTTKGASTLFPGYYSYWGYSKSVSTTVATTDWKIIKGGVKEISELDFAIITKNVEMQNRINSQLKKESKRIGIGFAMFVPSLIVVIAILAIPSKGGDPSPKWIESTFVGAATIGTIGLATIMKKSYSGHYTSVEQAAQDAQQYNKLLKQSLGLPLNLEPENR